MATGYPMCFRSRGLGIYVSSRRARSSLDYRRCDRFLDDHPPARPDDKYAQGKTPGVLPLLFGQLSQRQQTKASGQLQVHANATAPLTFGQFLSEFRTDFGGWSPNTWRGLSGMLRKLEKEFGQQPLESITTREIERYLTRRRNVDGISGATANRPRRHVAVLRIPRVKCTNYSMRSRIDASFLCTSDKSAGLSDGTIDP